MRSFALLLLTLSFAADGTVFGQIAQSQPAAASAGYVLGPGDVISIKALGEPSFDVEALTVDEEGNILLPYSDQPIVAKCKTERGLQADVIQAWSKYLRKPQISLRVTQRNSRPPVSVYGEVQKPQQFDLTRRAYLLELISFAGGPTEKSGGMIQVFRTRPPVCGLGSPSNDWKIDSGTDVGLSVPSKLFGLAGLRQGNEESNPEIMPGDIILLPKAAPVYVVGEVLKPGEMNLPDGGLPLSQAVAMASGITREAKTKTIKIYRRKPGSTAPEVIVANFDSIRKGTEKDILLQPFDIVEVGKAPKGFADYLLEFATGIPGRIPLPIRPI